MQKLIWTFLIAAFPVAAMAQSADLRVSAGCGPTDAKFSVKTDKRLHSVAAPNNGSAIVYVIMQEVSDPYAYQLYHMTTRVGLDGTWTGANHGNSYFSFTVSPGSHRMCTDVQSSLPGAAKLNDALSLTAVAGETYFYSAELTIPWKEHPASLVLQPLDQSKGMLLLSQSALSTFAAK